MFKNLNTGLFFLVLSFAFLSCDKDNDTPVNSDTPQYNDLGLQVDIEPINQDTLAIYSPTAIEIENQDILTNDFQREYTLKVDTKKPEKLKKGNVIVDYANGGRIWIIKDTTGTSNKSSSLASKGFGIKAILGTLDVFFKNAIIEMSTPSNRAKNASTNPNKLESGKFKLSSGTKPPIKIDIPNISIKEQTVAEGVSLSVNNNTVAIELSNLNLYSNSSNTFNISIPEGKLLVNNAVDMKFKYLPINKLLVGIPSNIGILKEFDSSIYTTIDTDVKLNIQATTNEDVNLIEPIEKELGSYTKVIPIPPYFAASIKVSLKARLKVTSNAELNVTPEISTKNNFEARANYKGLNSIPSFNPKYENIETNLANSVNGNFNLNQRFEIIPEVEVYAYGLLGPKGEIIAYEEFNANANIQNSPVTWDADIDLGIDYKTSLDASIFHIDELSSSIGVFSDNVFEYDLFTSPSSSTITLGNNQAGQINTVLNSSIEIQVKNSRGENVPGVPVFFETSNGSFSSDYIITDADGIAVNNWTLGNTTGEQNAIAYLKDGTGNKITTTELSITATAGNTTTINPVTSPLPNNNATDVALSGNLSFTEGTNTPTDATFKIYFDTNSQPTTIYNLNANVNTLAYSNLQEGTQYFWKVETISNSGAILATSPIWKFTTLNNTATTEPASNPTPNSGLTDVDLNGNLSFTAGANTPTDAMYRLYFDTNTNPTTQYELNNQTSYNYSNLQENTTYYWYVETLSNNGTLLATSSVWNFTTQSNSSGGVFDGNIQLNTQEEVNNFGANNYSEITGYLRIGEIVSPNNSIVNLSPLSSIKIVNSLSIGGNNQLTSLDGLEINNISGTFISIQNNALIKNLNAINNIRTSNPTGLGIVDNPNLEEIGEFINLNDFFHIIIRNNDKLEKIDEFNNISTICGSLGISDNDNLNEISGFINLKKVSGDCGSGDFGISANNSLSSIVGFNSIEYIKGEVKIWDNDILDSLTFFNGLSFIGNDLKIFNNSTLSDFCGIKPLFTSGTLNGQYEVMGNGFNPSQQDIIDGNCSN